MKRVFVLLAFAMLCCNAIAQNFITEYFQEWQYFTKPKIIDEKNNQGKTYSADDYFRTPKAKTNFEYNIKADNGLVDVAIDKEIKHDYYVCRYYFTIAVNNKQKVEFVVESNAKYKVSVNGEKVCEKLSQEDTLSEASKNKIEKTLAPGNYTVGIALLCEKEKLAGNQYKLRTTLATENLANNSNDGLTLKTMLCGENPYSISIAESGDMYLICYKNTKDNGEATYRMEVRQSSDDKIIYKEDNYVSYSWFMDKNILYKTANNKICFLDPLTGQKAMEDVDMQVDGLIYFLGNQDEYIVSNTSKKDNTSGDLRRIYLPDDRIPGWRDRTVLYLAQSGSTSPMFHTYRSTYMNDINASKTKILFSMSDNNITKRPFTFTSIYEYDLENGTIDTLVKEDGFASYAQYLMDGENIAILASNEAFNSIGSTVKKNQIPNAFNNSLYLMNLRTKEINPICKNFNPCVQSFIVRENNIYLTCKDKDSINVYKYNLKNKTFALLDLNVDIVHSFDISKDEKVMVYYGENYNKPNRVFKIMDNKTKEVYFPKQDAYSRMKIGKMENFSFRMHNSDIDGRIYYPADFDQTKKYPMVVYYYGGCDPTDRSFEMRYSAYLYTQQGYIVYVINPSGTVGWGQEFAARHTNAWGDYTADEIIEGVKRVCKQYPFIDAKHIGCMGASYGGFMTQYLQTKTDIFACAISHAGISNITSYWGEGYWGYSYSGAASAESYPWNNPELYTKHSPLFNADKIHTPLLLLHGTSDTNVPIGESIQMYNALKILGREVEFVTVKGEDHGIVDFNKRMQWNNTIYAWFAKWLKGDSSWWDEMYPKEDF